MYIGEKTELNFKSEADFELQIDFLKESVENTSKLQTGNWNAIKKLKSQWVENLIG